MATVEFKKINKIYPGNAHIVKDLDLEISDGEFVVFLGPSGCGKSTILRMLSGLEDITNGELLIRDKVVNSLSPKERNIAMVFQSYALYPHMTVKENIGFSLKMEKKPKDYIDKEVRRVADMLQLTPLLDRKPKALSGGQRQRVAMGRAMIRTPDVFLFDEPLSNLDAKLRNVMRAELKDLHQKLRKTTVYVTHDQVEAMTLADKVVVLKDGMIEQVGTPKEVYHHPANKFVASFIGSPTMNMLTGNLCYKNQQWFLTISEQEIALDIMFDPMFDGEPVTLGVRPSDIYHKSFNDSLALDVEIESTELLGSNQLVHTNVSNENFIIETSSDLSFEDITQYQFYMDPKRIHFFDKKGVLIN